MSEAPIGYDPEQVVRQAKKVLARVRSGSKDLDTLRQIADDIDGIVKCGHSNLAPVVALIRGEILANNDVAGAEKMFGILKEVLPGFVKELEGVVGNGSRSSGSGEGDAADAVGGCSFLLVIVLLLAAIWWKPFGGLAIGAKLLLSVGALVLAGGLSVMFHAIAKKTTG